MNGLAAAAMGTAVADFPLNVGGGALIVHVIGGFPPTVGEMGNMGGRVVKGRWAIFAVCALVVDNVRIMLQIRQLQKPFSCNMCNTGAKAARWAADIILAQKFWLSQLGGMGNYEPQRRRVSKVNSGN